MFPALITLAIAIATMTAADPPKAVEGAADALREGGIPREKRLEALARAAAAKKDSTPLLELVGAVESCAGCAAAKDLAEILASWDVKALAEKEMMAKLVALAASTSAPEQARVAAIRAINAVPEAQWPEGAKKFKAVHVVITAVPAQMRYDPKEFTVAPGVPVEIELRNPDTLQHNLLVVAPGALAEIGMAGDKMGESADGKAKQYVPDSPKVLHVMGLIDPGKNGVMWFISPQKPATYPLVCTYPSHWRMMNGKMRVVAPEGGDTAPKAGASEAPAPKPGGSEAPGPKPGANGAPAPAGG